MWLLTGFKRMRQRAGWLARATVAFCATALLAVVAVGRRCRGWPPAWMQERSRWAAWRSLSQLVSLPRRGRPTHRRRAAIPGTMLMDMADNRVPIEYRVEAIQANHLVPTVSAHVLNLRLPLLRRQRDETRALADTDELTGLPNRRAGLGSG